MSFNTGLSGLNAAAKSLDVIGHNISNANTVGMKSSRAEFSEVYASSLAAAGGGGFGIGVNVAAVTQQFTQGNITVTGNDLDLAINGGGFFVTELANGSRAYTRAGNFKLNNDGNIVTNDGAKLVDPRTNETITLPTGAGISGTKTENINLELNLDTRRNKFVEDPAITPQVQVDAKQSVTDVGTSIQVFDNQGSPISVDVYFVKNDANKWDVFARFPITDTTTPANGGVYPNDTDLFGVGAGKVVDTTSPFFLGSVDFDDDGSILDVTAVNAPTNGSDFSMQIKDIQIPGGATLPFNVDLNLAALTQNAQAFTVTALEQDGQAPGQLTGIQVEANGVISARYSNGNTLDAGQLMLANFRNVSGLTPVNGGYWVETFASGAPVISEPGTGNFGSLRSGALEESNVDLTNELVNMMTAQRTYQANAQTIKTQDQVLSTLVNLR